MLNIIVYHYVRNNEEYRYDCYARRKDEFESQINFFQKNSEIIDPKDNEKLFYFLNNDSKKAYLLTFDDAYKDHNYCANYLHSIGSSAIFFTPINALNNNLLDVNIIHFLLGSRGIDYQDLLESIISILKKRDFSIFINGKYLSIKEYLKTQNFEDRFDSKIVMAIKSLLQRDIKGLDNRKFILNSLLKDFYNINVSDFANELYLSKLELDNMYKKGMVFGSHGLTHQWLHTLSYEDQYKEIYESFNELKKLNILKDNDPMFLGYPYGSYNENTIKINKEIGVKLSFTTEVGSSFVRYEEEDCYHKLKRWDTNDAWCSKYRKPKEVN